MVILLVINAVLLSLLLIALLLYVSYRRDRKAAAAAAASGVMADPLSPVLSDVSGQTPLMVNGSMPSQVLDLRSDPPRIYTVPGNMAPGSAPPAPPASSPAEPIDAASANAAADDSVTGAESSPTPGQISERYDNGGNTLSLTIDLIGMAAREGITNLVARLITMGLRPIESEDDGAVLAAADGRMVRIAVEPAAPTATGAQASRYRVDTLAYPNGMAVFHIVHSLLDTGFVTQWQRGDEILFGTGSGAVARAQVHVPEPKTETTATNPSAEEAPNA